MKTKKLFFAMIVAVFVATTSMQAQQSQQQENGSQVEELTEVQKLQQQLEKAKAEEKYQTAIKKAADEKAKTFKAIEDGKKVGGSGTVASSYKSSKEEIFLDEENEKIYYRKSDKEALDKWLSENPEYADWGQNEEPR